MSKKLGIIISGSGSNLAAIIDKCESGYIDAEIAVVISNNSQAYGLKRAQNHGIETAIVNPKEFSNRQEYDKKLVEILKKYQVDLVVLAGYMLLVTNQLLDPFKYKVINIHPALLPSFPGTDGIGDALKYGVKVTGVTVHFVDEGCDTGPIILQEALQIKEIETKEELADRIHSIEHRLLPEAVKLFVEDRLEINGRLVKVLN